MSNYEATRYDFDGANLTDIEGLNTGLIVPWSDNSTPSGFLDCDGSAVSRDTYAALFAVIGTNYGSGDGSTTFNLPDLTDRTCVHKSPTKAQFSTGGGNTAPVSAPVAATVGNTTLSVPTIASHTHPSPNSDVCGAPSENSNPASAKKVGSGLVSGSEGGGGAHNHPSGALSISGNADILQPYLTIKYIIKT